MGSVRGMLSLLQDLIRHKAYANASLLRSVSAFPPAAQDPELRSLLHHVILANRFWLFSCLDAAFSLNDESRVPATLGAVIERYRHTHDVELDWVSRLGEGELTRQVAGPLVPGGRCTIAEALTQVCLHSHGHRAQCATRLRTLGGAPPSMDYILWIPDRPTLDWPAVE